VILELTAVQKQSLLFSSVAEVVDKLYILTFMSPQNNHTMLLKLPQKYLILWQTSRMENTNIKIKEKNQTPQNKHDSK